LPALFTDFICGWRNAGSRRPDPSNAKAGSFEFPLRQQQIADALGLTAVHVCKVISRMRNARMIELEGRRLKILDPKALAFMADQ